MRAKKILWILLAVFVIGMIWLQDSGVSQEFFWTIYGVSVAALFIVLVAINQKELRTLQTELEQLRSIRSSNPQEYIKRLQQMLEGKKSRAVQALLMTELGAGYMASGDYEAAKRTLLAVPEKGLNVQVGQMYYTYLGLTLFHLDKEEAARKLMVLKAKEFSQAQNNPEIAPFYHMLQILCLLSEAKQQEARAYLARHPELEEQEDCQADMRLIQRKL